MVRLAAGAASLSENPRELCDIGWTGRTGRFRSSERLESSL
jgi:hypothetical protein